MSKPPRSARCPSRSWRPSSTAISKQLCCRISPANSGVFFCLGAGRAAKTGVTFGLAAFPMPPPASRRRRIPTRIPSKHASDPIAFIAARLPKLNSLFHLLHDYVIPYESDRTQAKADHRTAGTRRTDGPGKHGPFAQAGRDFLAVEKTR